MFHGVLPKRQIGLPPSISPDYRNGNANQMITITYVANPLITEREATLTLSATDAGTESIDITLTQAQATTTRPPSVLGFPAVEAPLRFFPNPATNTLYIEGVREATALIIRTFSGATLLRATLRQNQSIDIAALPQGVYLFQSSHTNHKATCGRLRGQSAQEQITRRLVIGF